MALGSSLQVHRLQLSHKPVAPEPKKDLPVVQVQENTEIIPIKQEVSPEESFKEEPQVAIEEEAKDSDVKENIPREQIPVNDSIESIGNIASFLNKNTDDDVIDSILLALGKEELDIEDELKSADRHSYGYLHPESLLHLLKELRLGIDQSYLERFIGIAMKQSVKSNERRILFSDILRALRIEPAAPSNINHCFNVTVHELFGCSIISQLPSSSVYLKYLFPQETCYIESDLLESGKSIPINLEAHHTCTIARSSSLTETFSPACLGIQFLLCKNVSRCEEQVIARGLLPVEELTDMNNLETQNRVICLYGDRKETIKSHRNDIIGKLKVRIKYSSEDTMKETGRSTEIVFEKKTEVQRMLPKHNTLTIYFEKISELSRAEQYYRDIGLDNLLLKARFSCFGGEIVTEARRFGEDVLFEYKHQLPLILK